MMQRIQDNDSKSAALSMLSMEELEVVKKVLDYTLAREDTTPNGKRPLVADPSGLSADDMVIYRKMAERAECRSLYPKCDPNRNDILGYR